MSPSLRKRRTHAARRLIGGVLGSPIEWSWSRALQVVRRIPAASKAHDWGTGGARVAVVAPHPDDETVGAGGVAALHARRGDSVTVVVVTDGSASRALDIQLQEMARLRHAEVSAAVGALELTDLVCLGAPERAWSASTVRAKLAPIIADVDIVYAPSCVDYHPDHLGVAQVLSDVVGPKQLVRVYEIGVPLTPTLVNLVVDIRSTREQKERALRCFATQLDNLAPLARLARYRRPLYGPEHAEVFWQMGGAAYRHVISSNRWDWHQSPFRAVRGFPLTDPLAFAIGHTVRKRLRSMARTIDGTGRR